MWSQSRQQEVSHTCFQTCGHARWPKQAHGFDAATMWDRNKINRKTLMFSNRKNIIALRKRSLSGSLFSTTLVFPHDKNTIWGQLYHHMWQCDLFSSTLLYEPCSPKFTLKPCLSYCEVRVAKAKPWQILVSESPDKPRCAVGDTRQRAQCATASICLVSPLTVALS